jgi:hypothetical protein
MSTAIAIEPPDTSVVSQISGLVFRYADADGACSLCDQRNHLIAACCFEVREEGGRELCTGLEVCPACLHREGNSAGEKTVRKFREDLISSGEDDRSPTGQQNHRDIIEYGDGMVELVRQGKCIMPPVLPIAWIASSKL